MSRDLRLLAGAVFLSAAGDLLALDRAGAAGPRLTGSGLAVSALVATTLVPDGGARAAGGARRRPLRERPRARRRLAGAGGGGRRAGVHGGDLAAILALSALLAAGNAFAQPAEFTLVPAVAAGRRVTEATGIVEAARYAGFAAGPLLAAGLAALGPRPALLAERRDLRGDRGGGGGAARPPPAVPPRAAEARALDGLRLLGRDRVLRVTLAPAVAALLFVAAALTVEIFYVKDVVGASDSGYALVLCGWMAGMVLGATAPARRVPVRLVAAAALAALAVQGAGLGLQAAWAILPVAFAGYLVGGVGHGLKNVLLRALIAVRVPEAVHGRAFAAYNAARSVAELGALGAGGVLVTALGPRAALVLAGLGPILAAAAGQEIGQNSWLTADEYRRLLRLARPRRVERSAGGGKRIGRSGAVHGS